MSSIMEQSPAELSNRPAKLEKRTFFLRSSSIQKIKCSATYPFRIAGSKLSREVIKRLIESLIIKARLVSQKALLILYIASLKVLGAISHLSTRVSTYDDVYDKSKETEKEQTFAERLLTRVIKLHTHKLQHQENIKEKKIGVQAKTETELRTDYGPVIEPAFRKRLLPVAKIEPKKPNLVLLTVVYASAIFIYIQLLALAIALNMAPTPPGLIFLIVSLSLIAYLAFKVFLQENKRISKRVNPASKEVNPPVNNAESSQGSTDTPRQSRLKIRRNFDFGGKTLSKIKML